MKKECKIVQDLLPNYIEKVTNDETNIFIEEHLKGCQECNNIYNSMKENLKVEQIDIPKQEVKYMKKFKNKMKVLKLIIIFILLFIIFVIGRRTIMMTLLNSKGEKLQGTMTNYYAKAITTYKDGYMSKTETYYKDGNFLTKHKLYKEGELITDIIIYKKDEEKIALAEYNDGKKVRLKNVVAGGTGPTMDTSTFESNLVASFSTKVEKLNIDSKECYVIKHHWGDRFIDKETGFIVKEISYENNRVIDYYLEPGIVKDEDIQRPDTTGYVLVD